MKFVIGLWHRLFGKPKPHVHKFEPFWTAPHELIARCDCGEVPME